MKVIKNKLDEEISNYEMKTGYKPRELTMSYDTMNCLRKDVVFITQDNFKNCDVLLKRYKGIDIKINNNIEFGELEIR